MLKKFFCAVALVLGVMVVSVGSARAAVLVDAHLTDTAQFRTAEQNPYFNEYPAFFQRDVVGVNFNYGSGVVGSTTKFLGVGFDNINVSTSGNATPPPAGPFNLFANPGTTVPTLTLDFPWTGTDNTPRPGSFGVTGTDATILNSQIGAQVFFYRPSDHPSTNFQFSNLSPNTRMYVQLIGSNFGGTGVYGVTANGSAVGNWTSAPSSDAGPPATYGSLFAFDTMTDSLGNLDINVFMNGGNYGGLAGIMISEQVLVPEPSTGLLLGLGSLCMIRRMRRRSVRG